MDLGWIFFISIFFPGLSKLASVPAGSVVTAPAAAAGAAGAGAAPAAGVYNTVVSIISVW